MIFKISKLAAKLEISRHFFTDVICMKTTSAIEFKYLSLLAMLYQAYSLIFQVGSIHLFTTTGKWVKQEVNTI